MPDGNEKSNLLMEVSIMESFLNQLQSTLTSPSLNNVKPELRKAILANNLRAIEGEYMATVHANLRGFHLAGINVSFVPFIN